MSDMGEAREEHRVYEEKAKEYRFPSFDRMDEFARSMPFGMRDE